MTKEYKEIGVFDFIFLFLVSTWLEISFSGVFLFLFFY
jgi:hypothetical protein